MIRRPPRSTRTDTLFPYTTLWRLGIAGDLDVQGERLERGAAFPARRAWRRRRLAVDDRTEAIVPGRMVVRAAAYIIGPARNLDELAAVADRKSTRLNSSH